MVSPADRNEWWSDEPPMESQRHVRQMHAIIAALEWRWRDRSDVFVAGNLTIYYSPTRSKSVDFRGPDVFVVFGVDGKRERRSWVVWDEGDRYPDVIIELLSDSTAHIDRGAKKAIYEQVFKTPEYFLFDPFTAELEGFRLTDGRYEPIAKDHAGRLESERLELWLGTHDGELRFYTRDGKLVETEAEEQRARADRAEAEIARLRAELDRAKS